MEKIPERKDLKIDFSRDRKFFEQEGSSRVITSGSLYMFFALINAGCIWVFIILGTGWEGLKYFGLTTAINGIVGLMGIGISRYFIAEIKTAFIVNGVAPIRSVGAARYMKARVPGMDVPDSVIARLQGVPKDQVSREGIKLCVDIISQVREIEGVAGIHLMAIEWEEVVPEIVGAAGLLPRPSPLT